MGESGDYWREHRDYLRSQGINRSRPKRAATLVRFSKKFEKLGFKKFTDWHWQATVAGEILDYWPSKEKWRYRGVTQTGEAKMLALFGKK